MGNQRPGMFANQMPQQQGTLSVVNLNFLAKLVDIVDTDLGMNQGNYMFNQSGQQTMMDVNNTGGNQMMGNTGNPGGGGGQFNVPMQQYQTPGPGMMRTQQQFVQGNANQPVMQPRVPMNQVQRYFVL